MKKITVLILFTFLFNSFSFSQLFPKEEKKEYIYGKMVNKKKERIGYFWFDNKNIYNGQLVYYLKTMETTYAETFYSRKYDYFVSDSLYLETFEVPIYIGETIKIMIPRIVDGEIQLFGVQVIKKNIFYFFKSIKDNYFIKTRTAKINITKKQFKEQMKDLIGKDQVLLDKINSGELTYDDLPEIIQSYNQNNN